MLIVNRLMVNGLMDPGGLYTYEKTHCNNIPLVDVAYHFG